MIPSTARLEELGRILLAEIGLKQPHHVATGLRGFVAISEGRRVMEAPWPTSTREALYILAHEVGHWQLHTEPRRLGRWAFRDDIPDHLMEYESERYAHRRLREFGVPVPRAATCFARLNVGHHVRKELRSSTNTPAATIARWSGVDVDKERRAEWGVIAWKALARCRRGRPDGVDFVFGPLSRTARLGAMVRIRAFSGAARDWAEANLPQPVGQPLETDYWLGVEDIVAFLHGASRAGLMVKRM